MSLKYKVGTDIEVTANTSCHELPIGSEGVITNICGTPECGYYEVKGETGTWYLDDSELKGLIQNTVNMTYNYRKMAVEVAAQYLLNANNSITTLEVKNHLRTFLKNEKWNQADVSLMMDDLATKGVLSFTSTGTYRVYSRVQQSTQRTNVTVPSPKVTIPKPVGPSVPTLTRKDARKMMENNKGHYFTASFYKVDGSQRTLNAQYSSKLNTSPDPQFLRVKAGGFQGTKSINIHTLYELKIQGKTYKVI
jgi:hypothetical protein